jgi:hypothetical protein
LSLIAALILIGQFAVFSALTVTGWGSAPIKDVVPPRMEDLGAPPDLIPLYADLTHIAFRVQSSTTRPLGIAVFAGTAAAWGGSEPPPPSFDPLHESLSKIIKGKLGETFNTLLFVIPGQVLAHNHLYVRIQGGRYELEVVKVDPARGYALAATTVENRLLSFVGSSLSWLTLPAPRSVRVPLMVVARGPDPRSFSLARGVIGRGARAGRVMVAVHGSEVGAPVVAATPSGNWLAGFAEEGGGKQSRFVPAAAAARALRAAAASLGGG